MHRHAYKDKKLSLKAGPRRALTRGLIDSLILYERIETTQVRARAIVPDFERLVTKAKKGDLHNARQVMSAVISPVAGEKLLKELALGFADRNGGYTRVIKTGNRRGDNAPMAVIELVLPDNFDPNAQQAKASKPKPAIADDKSSPVSAKLAKTQSKAKKEDKAK